MQSEPWQFLHRQAVEDYVTDHFLIPSGMIRRFQAEGA